MTYNLFPIVFQDIKEAQNLLLHTLRCQAQQESSQETTRHNNVLLHKLCGLKKTVCVSILSFYNPF